MESHKPKPAHSLRELVREVAVVVLGIAIALAAEQTVESLAWRHKTQLADEQMRQEIAADDGPQVVQRIAISPCVNGALDAIRGSVEQGAPRASVLETIDRFWTPRHTWDSVAFQAATSSGVLSRVSPGRIGLLSYFYSVMPAIEGANQREFHGGAMLHALSRVGGPLTETERERLLEAVESLRRDDAEIVRLSTHAKDAMKLLDIRAGDWSHSGSRASALSVPERVINEVENLPMARGCIAQLKKSLEVP